MIDAAWLLFVATSLLVIATPGQDMILVMSRWVAQGPAAGVLTAAGIGAGRIGHTALAALGLGAILPQFVPQGAAHPTLSVFALGLAFAALTFVVKAPVGLFAGLLSGWLRARPQALLGLHRTSGAVLVGLGLKLAFEPTVREAAG